MLQVLEAGDNAYVVYWDGMDDHNPEECCDEWNELVADIRMLPDFGSISEAVEAARSLDMRGYASPGIDIYTTKGVIRTWGRR